MPLVLLWLKRYGLPRFRCGLALFGSYVLAALQLGQDRLGVILKRMVVGRYVNEALEEFAAS